MCGPSKLNGVCAAVRVKAADDLAVVDAQENFDCNRGYSLEEVAGVHAHLAVAYRRVAVHDRLAVQTREVADGRHQLHRLRAELAPQVSLLLQIYVAEHRVAHRADG